ncbi:AAA family ATPase [Polaribacter litorisediminis]|uniref:AAA family ATPase n=1 Tax=Polaribacter litorisediminis TaxID=1908341 RepID=UPI001CBC32FF|nr:AAA family ATPase [Polaribacter litorisediminis]UAM99542.1 AAA family ATPase [Polaribacter litorisediminis]
MINKIEKLVSIGKYRNYTATGQVNFKKLTLIYGDNGGGKTTLTSVLRSLTSDNPSIIRSRISTAHTQNQAAQITQLGTPNIYHTFGASGWTRPFPNIEIFDIHFVNENIYSGFDFNEEHKKQLHQFVIGAQGVAIQNQIEQNKLDKANSRQNQTILESQLIQQVGNNITSELITSFLSIPSTDFNGIDPAITAAELKLTNARANSIIQTLQLTIPIAPVNANINFTTLLTDLQTTIQSIQNQTLEQLFASHCQDLNDNTIQSAENWLQTGYKYITSKESKNETDLNCPFCQQSINNSMDIISAYTSKFKEEFNAFLVRLRTHLTSLQNFNLDATIQGINTGCTSNNSKITFWANHLPNTVQAPINSLISNASELQTEFQTLISLVEQKIQNPTTAINTSSLTTFQTLIQDLTTNITAYNQSVTLYNTAITAFKGGIQTIENAQLEVDRLKRIKKRFEPAIVQICNQIVAEKQRLRALTTAYPILIQQQNTAATAFFSSYQTRINHYLGAIFKTPFRIDTVEHIAPRGRATQSKINYTLTINGNPISFDTNQPLSAKECLSEGDKSTIALAFFLSKLDIDPNHQNKILVFDDPLSSLDTNRRTYTIGIIKSALSQLKQVIVLSHNEYFLHAIGKDIPIADKSTLRIKQNFSANSSELEPCNLEELVQNDYFKHLKALENFRTNPDHSIKDTVLGWLRNVLESHLRFKFYRELRTMTGQQTFGRLISFLDTSGVIFRDNGNRSDIINNLNLINSVSWMPHHGNPAPNYSIIGINPHTITASELDNLIQDTLMLIDTRL